MNETPKPTDAVHLLMQLHRHQQSVHQSLSRTALSPSEVFFRAWQSQRLARTHADLLASDRYGPGCRFFLDHIYAPRDFSQRDQDVERMHKFMLRFLPERMLHTLTLTIELNNLTRALDAQLLDVLVNQLGVTDSLTPQQYARGYQLCDNLAVRRYQIELIGEVGRGIDRLTRLPFITLTLRLAHGPAYRAGWIELQDFLEQGFAAFKHMQGADYFLQTIQRRELRILDQLMSNAAKPFAI